MAQQTYVFDAELAGCEGVRRTIAIRDDMTLVDLHYALQSAFGWDDDHLYSFWLKGAFWASDEDHYSHPSRSDDPLGKSACARLETLGLSAGRQIAYVYDFVGAERRVRLTLSKIVVDGACVAARVLESVGVVPR